MPSHRFKYQPPTAGEHQVGIAGDFTDWEILDLEDSGGVYSLTLYIENGRYRYKLIVDGIWMPDPANPRTESDPFGGLNSVLVIQPKAAPSFTWHDVWDNLSLLEERRGHYLSLNRMSETGYELRFNWFPWLPAEIMAIVDGKEISLSRLGSADHRDVYHCLFISDKRSVPAVICVKDGSRSLWLGAAGFTASKEECQPWQVALAELPVFSVPEWAQSGIVYQIFPDRFCNGDPALDPDFSEWYYDDCRTPPPAGEYLPPNKEYFHFVPDWYDVSSLKQSPWLPSGKPDWWSFYGGDLPGARQKLPYLKDLGITVIYFNPLWQAKSNHKYDAADFGRIDPHFGTSDDLKALVGEAHALGIHVIVDVAFNHTGETFWAFRDCVEKGQKSPYWNWYDWQKWPLPQPLPPDFDPKEYYQCWWGIKDMPDLNFDLLRTHPSENYIKDIAKALPNEALVAHLLDCVRWWLLEMDIDGFRLDVPDEVPYWFWELFRAKVKQLKPEAWIVGEIWHSAGAWIGPRYFDSVMNYAHFKDPVLDFFILGTATQQEFRAAIEAGLAQYPTQAMRGMMNLLGSHDTVRVLELAKGDVSRLKLALLFQMTFPGTPHIYYGDEIGMRGGKDPDNRRPFNWLWESDPQARELRKYYQALIRLRRAHPPLQTGEFSFLDSPDGVLSYTRQMPGSVIKVYMNCSVSVRGLECSEAGEILFSPEDISFEGKNLVLQPQSAVVLCCK